MAKICGGKQPVASAAGEALGIEIESGAGENNHPAYRRRLAAISQQRESGMAMSESAAAAKISAGIKLSNAKNEERNRRA